MPKQSPKEACNALHDYITEIQGFLDQKNYYQVILRSTPLIGQVEAIGTKISEDIYKALRICVVKTENNIRQAQYDEVSKGLAELLQIIENME